jgi:hypothetical protein
MRSLHAVSGRACLPSNLRFRPDELLVWSCVDSYLFYYHLRPPSEALASGKEDQARIANILHNCHLIHR